MQLDFKRGSRAFYLAIVTLVIMAIFVIRLFYLQVIRHDYYTDLAKQEQTKQLVIPAKRGEIYAMDDGQPVKLVLNETIYTVFADPKVVDKPQEIIDNVRKVAGGNARSNLEELLGKKESRYQILATKVSRKQAEMLKNTHLKGLGFQAETQRVYPEGQLASQTLGFVDGEGNGKYGLEQELNDKLAGKDGLLRSVTDVSNVPLTIGNDNVNQPAKNGDNVVLTVDRNIQSYAEKALAQGLKNSHATDGSVMVIDPKSGKIMAMANLPTYNPAEINKVQDAGAFNNGTVATPYEPGSDIKALTVTVGVDKGAITPASTFNNTDSVKIEDRTISNATKGQTGNITIQTALNYSLNTGMVEIMKRLGDGNNITLGARNTLYEYFHDKLGLGELTGVELAGEAKGIVIPPTDSDGGAVRYSNMAFGQGMDVTMLQVCSAFSTIVNGGTYYYPTVLAGKMSDDGRDFTAQPIKTPRTSVISPTTASTVREMVHQARHTFYASQDKPGYYVGGKTGTSQVIENGQYAEDQTIGTYLGFGGSSPDDPRYVIMVQISGKHMLLAGNKDAMPIFTDISNWLIDYLKLQPKG
jgi:cell division protein FtsI/penicillin-binding protein 2